MEFNINEWVRFKVRGEGERIMQRWWHRNDDILDRSKLPLSELKPDAEGYYSMQAWEFMQVWGPHVYMGPIPPIETTILLEVVETQRGPA